MEGLRARVSRWSSSPGNRSDPGDRPGLRRIRAPIVIVLASIACVLPSAALGSPFRRLAPSTVAFASDGSGYAVWQVHTGSPIVVLDTLTGARHEMPRPAECNLANEEENGEPRSIAAAGRFLLLCTMGEGGLYGVLDMRSGKSFRLPGDAIVPQWTRLGSMYAEGEAAGQRCTHSPAELKEAPNLACTALFDLATGAVSYRPLEQVVDLDRPGAPSECQALQQRGFSLRSERAPSAYGDGLLAHEAHRRGAVELDRCHGHPTILPGRGEPVSFNLGGGLLTWDNGHDATTGEPGPGDYPEALSSYRPANRERHSWMLPDVSVTGTGRYIRPGFAYGYSTHTANTVFWIATRTLLDQGAGDVEDVTVAISSVYAAHLK